MPRRLAQKIVLVGFALALVAVPLAPTGASQTPHSYHWGRKPFQFTLQVGNNVSGGWNSLFRRTIGDWNRNDTITIREVGGAGSAQECRASQGRVEVCSWRYGTQEGWLGLTRLYFNPRGDHVESATVQMNDSFFDQSNGQYNSDSARLHTICHELGHALGLDHVNTGSCMNDSQHAVFNNLEPMNKDFNQLARIYDHKDAHTTVAGAQKKQKKKGKKNKKKQNRKKRQRQRERRQERRERAAAEGFFSPASLPSVPSGLDSSETEIVQRLDDGRKVVTRITWAQN